MQKANLFKRAIAILVCFLPFIIIILQLEKSSLSRQIPVLDDLVS